MRARMRVTHGPGSSCQCAHGGSSPPPLPGRRRSGHFTQDLMPLSHPPGARSGMDSPASEEHSLSHTMSQTNIKSCAPQKLDQIDEIKLDRVFADLLGDSSEGAVLRTWVSPTFLRSGHPTPPSWASRNEGNQHEPGVSPDPGFGF